MKGFITSLLLWAICFTAQATPQNMDFSQVKDEKPEHWYIQGSEPDTISDDHPTSAGQSLRLNRTSSSEASFASAAQRIPFSYDGQQLTISGWIKTEQVTADGAAFWLRLHSGQDMVAFDNMHGRRLVGDQAWQQVQLSVDVPAGVDSLVFGGILIGTGQAYFADLKLTLDGVAIEKAPKAKFLRAAAPHEFEQDSGIRLTALSQQQHANLAALAKVWGFIKYYHPESAAGNISMDAELFKLIPNVLKADAKARDQLLVQWIKGLGQLNGCKKCKDSTNAALAHPAQHWLTWQLSPELNNALANVYAAELPARHYWVGSVRGVGNPVFNEKSYAEVGHEDSGYRLLAVFRLWNIIHYYSPYRDLTEQPWPQALDTAISDVIAASDETQYLLALATFISAIDDTHTQLWPNQNSTALADYIGRNIAPAEVRFIEDKPVVRLVYDAESALQVGDIITHIGGKPVAERLAYLRPLAAASNEPTRYRQFAWMLLHDNAGQLDLKIERAGQAMQLTVPLVERSSLQRQFGYYNVGDTAYQILPDNIGYVRLDKIAEVDLEQMMQQLADTKGLVIDIRNYPSDFVVYSLGKYLYPQPYPFAKFTQIQPSNPGQFNWAEPIQVGSENPDYYKGKVAILIDEHSQSQSEFTTMAFRGAPKARVIGSTTSGADGDFSSIVLPGGHYTALSGIGVFYPDGTPTQRIGIVPDIEVKPTIAGIAAGRDEQLEAAIEYINQQ
ncbi:S41 family peptidase [Arsukibacterium sp.]|uniref:S41 family peptidase n=1 Tax=Arsukibacterium sp. TaxID=1977258 RepID=UPI00299EE82C|nr:S41 family peptidase [Arsukibacterium sp.]MDX1539179.1 S41 family peptidase [Arsukibacterium sp.]